ncbi:S8 family serine peptidase [bacterium]|nr:S8 family serine peptidase [bacterium]
MKKTRLFSAAAGIALALAVSAPSNAQTTPPPENTVRPFWGDISPFYGDISPFWGDISPFWGDISPFWGDISPFYGDISPFWGDISPFWGDISPFWGDIAPFWGDISPFMSTLQTSSSGGSLDTASSEMFARSKAFWGATITARTGQTFEQAFSNALLAKYSLTLKDGKIEGVDKLSPVNRSKFLFDWYDGLMAYSGRDHVDHWMATANWNPKLTQIQGAGQDTVIGLIDFTVTDADQTDNLSWMLWSGEQNPQGGHGGAVASLLVSDHDGRGVMGIVPQATVAAFNPYDASGTTNWNMVANGVTQLVLARAAVVNMSLGVPGKIFDEGWRNVYNRWDVALLRSKTVFVHAAGNDGVVGSGLIDLQTDLSALNLIIVGSVGPSGQISPFSNTPGTACFISNGGKCETSQRLMNRFVVAPGEWILVTDGNGGVTRRSGTSLAAPMVTGAIALMQTRWGWLKDKPTETADIIFRSATDLGAPGVDPVYGWGLLNIQGSQSPLPGSALYQLIPDKSGELVKTYISSTSTSDPSSLWGAETGVMAIYEDVGSTYRDFQIPLDATLTSTTSATTKPLQSYLTDSLSSLSAETTTSSKRGGKRSRLFDDTALANPWGLELSTHVEPRVQAPGEEGLPFNTAVSVTGKGDATLRFGNGFGAMALGGQPGLTEAAYRPETGGANPMLGLASGGAFSKVELKAGTATLAFGATERSVEQLYADPASGEFRPLFAGLETYRASAAHISVTQPVGERLSLNAGYTLLREQDGLLGMQSLTSEWLSEGAVTDAATVGASLDLSPRLSLVGSATYGRTRDQDLSQALNVNKGGVHTTAFEAALNIDGVFDKSDRARFAIVQPMHIEAGSIDLTAGTVIDRTTGEIASTTTQTSIADRARVVALDAAYVRPLFDGKASIAGFVRAETALAEGTSDAPNHMAGARFSLAF